MTGGGGGCNIYEYTFRITILFSKNYIKVDSICNDYAFNTFNSFGFYHKLIGIENCVFDLEGLHNRFL